MERRAFLAGLLGVVGAAALAGVAQAAPIARSLDLADDKTPPVPGGRAPDGTEIEKAQVIIRTGPRRRWYRRHYVRPRRRYYRRARRVYRRAYRRRYW